MYRTGELFGAVAKYIPKVGNIVFEKVFSPELLKFAEGGEITWAYYEGKQVGGYMYPHATD